MTFLIATIIWSLGALLLLWAFNHSDDPEVSMMMGQMPQLGYWMALLWPITLCIIWTISGNKNK